MILQITNSQASVESDVIIGLKTVRYYDQLKLVTDASDQDVKLACLIAGRVNPTQVLSIRSFTNEIDRFALQQVREHRGSTFISPSKNLEFTDKRVGGTTYWYVYEFEEAPTDVRVFKKTRSGRLEVIDFLLEGNLLYHNLSNSFDVKSGAYTLYYITYNSQSATFTKLLETKSAISEISLDDIEADGSITSYKKRFLRELVVDRYHYSFHNTEDRLSYRGFSNRIETDLRNQSIEDSMFLSFSLSEFNTVFDGTSCSYLFPESYDIGELYDSNINYRMVTSSIVKVGGGQLIERESAPINIQVLNETGTLLTTYSNYGTNAINKIDYLNGFIELPMAMSSTWRLVISGTQKKDTYTYSSLDLNPFYNASFVEDSFYIFYWKPNDSSAAIHWLQFYNGKCIDCSDTALKLIVSDAYNPDTIVGLEYSALFEEKGYGNDNSYQYIFLEEIGYKKPPVSITAVDVHEKKILSSSFDYDAHHQVSVTDLVSERGLEYPLNNTIVIKTDYENSFTETQLKEAVARYASLGKLLKVVNVEDPIVLSIETDASLTAVTVQLCEGEPYTLWREVSHMGNVWEEVQNFTASETYSLVYTNPAAGDSQLQRYKLTTTNSDATVSDTNFIIEVIERS